MKEHFSDSNSYVENFFFFILIQCFPFHLIHTLLFKGVALNRITIKVFQMQGKLIFFYEWPLLDMCKLIRFI